MLPTISEGEPQPLDCKKCGTKEGYVVIEVIPINHIAIYDASGNPIFSDTNSEDGTIAFRRSYKKRPTCAKCGAMLPFRID